MIYLKNQMKNGEISVIMPGNHVLVYNSINEDKPIEYKYDGIGLEYAEVYYKGNTYYLSESDGWTFCDETGFEKDVFTRGDLFMELQSLLSMGIEKLIQNEHLKCIVEMFPKFFIKNNLDILYSPGESFINRSNYYVVEKGKEIDADIYDMASWFSIINETDHLYKIAKLILGVKEYTRGEELPKLTLIEYI